MRKSAALLLVLVFLTASCLAVKPTFSSATVVEDTWAAKAPMQQARAGLGVATVNGKIYAIGGSTKSGGGGTYTGGVVGTNEEYDPATDMWSFKKPMPTPREDFGIAIYQNKIYCIGGFTSDGFTGLNEVYDPATGTWETKSSLPTPRHGLGANVVNGKIYLIGGYVPDSSSSTGFSILSLNEVYDPAKDSWTTKAAVPTAVSGVLSAVIDSKIYVIMSGLNQIYDANTDTWSLGTPLPHSLLLYARAGATIGVNAPKRIYIVGDSGTLVYDPINDSWTNGASITANRGGFGVAVVNDILYAIGGYTATYPDILSLSMGPSVTPDATVEQYTPFGYGTPDPSYDVTVPEIAVVSPENKTYYTVDVALNFTVNEPVFSAHYTLDGETFEISGNTTLASLAVGAHNVTVSAFDAAGNMGASETVSFSVAEEPEPEPEPFPMVLVATASGASVAIIGVGLFIYFKKRKH